MQIEISRFEKQNLEISIFDMQNLEILRLHKQNIEIWRFHMQNLEISKFRICLPPFLLLDQTEARRVVKNCFESWRAGPYLSKGLDDRAPHLSESLDPPLGTKM